MHQYLNFYFKAGPENACSGSDWVFPSPYPSSHTIKPNKMFLLLNGTHSLKTLINNLIQNSEFNIFLFFLTIRISIYSFLIIFRTPTTLSVITLLFQASGPNDCAKSHQPHTWGHRNKHEMMLRKEASKELEQIQNVKLLPGVHTPPPPLPPTAQRSRKSLICIPSQWFFFTWQVNWPLKLRPFR